MVRTRLGRVAVHGANAQVHFPGVRGSERVRRARPVAAATIHRALQVNERISRRPLARSTRVGHSRKCKFKVGQTVQLHHVREAPVGLMASPVTGIKAIGGTHHTREIERLDITERGSPIPRPAGTIRIPQPDQSGQVVGHGAIAIIRKAWDGPLRAAMRVTVLPGERAGYYTSAYGIACRLPAPTHMGAYPYQEVYLIQIMHC